MAYAATGNADKLTTDDIIESIDVFGIVDTAKSCSQPNNPLECAKSAIGAMSTFDPTGLLGVAASFMHPVCKWD